MDGNIKKNPTQTLLLIDLVSFTSLTTLTMKAHIYPASIAWSACLELAISYLEPVEESHELVSTYCQEKAGTPEWDLEPCCNIA